MVKSIVASYESQEKNGHNFRFFINLRRKLSSENFCRKRQILTLSDPKIRGQEPKTLRKRAHNPLLKEAGLTKPTGAVPWLGGRLVSLACP